uniref:Uncharacterized protein n=1 Tax=Romanomermis culicivorax TaxID=13658 RepID=A0A915KFM5_ROMCU
MNFDSPTSGSVNENQQIDSRLAEFIVGENERLKFMENVVSFSESCFDKCLTGGSSFGSKMDAKTETCVVNCVNRTIDASVFLISRISSNAAAALHHHVIMNLSSQINSKVLKSVKTRITTISGQIYYEVKDSNGNYVEGEAVNVENAGFVVNMEPDLQVAELDKCVYIGSQDVAQNLELLREHEITHILNLSPIVENHFAENFVYENMPILDTPDFNIMDCLPRCLKFIDRALRQHDGSRVFIHCNAGVSRAAAIGVAYLMCKEKLNFEQSLDRVRSTRPCARPNDGFQKQLRVNESVIQNMRESDEL